MKKAMPALAVLAGLIGDPAVRHTGTIGGSLANNDPAADYPAAGLGLGATIRTNKRTIPADQSSPASSHRARGRRDHHQVAFQVPPRRATPSSPTRLPATP